MFSPRIEFRSIDVSDAAIIAAAVRFRRDSLACSFGDDQRFDEPHYVDWLKAKVERDPGLALHVFHGGALVGQLELGTFRPTPWVGYVHLYYLEPSSRGFGLASELDAYVARALRARGFASARLSVAVGNGRARRFYAKQGWKELGARPETPDLLLLEKVFCPPVLSVPTLETERLWLRALSELDAESYERHFADYEVLRFLSRRAPWPFPPGGVARHFLELAAGEPGVERWLWGLFPKQAPLECIGAVELFRPGKPHNRGFWLGRAYWGQGYMSEASHAATDCAFERLGFEELVLSNAHGNLRSRRIKERTPATFVGIQPGAYVDPALTETELWRLDRSAWQAFRKA
ncbi:MAG: GNAT family N-acetyltransferase [Polyangiaceae bacterium]|jgi:RimJ/RimL family protein N-acetyltransferase